jgi:hypothetical protein
MKHIDTRACIRTKYLGPTNYRGSRITVKDDNNSWSQVSPKRLIVDWNYELNVDKNHAAAAQAWLDKHMSKFAEEYDQRPIVSEPGLCFDGCYYWSWDWKDLNTAAKQKIIVSTYEHAHGVDVFLSRSEADMEKQKDVHYLEDNNEHWEWEWVDLPD